jgi:DNA-directed RNA polymerase specialized sigma24 family protein
MTGNDIALLMANTAVKRALTKYARRHSGDPDSQHDFIQDAWLRIGESEAGKSVSYYIDIGRKEIHAAWKREYRDRVDRIHGCVSTDIGEKGKTKHLYREKYLSLEAIELDSWYYEHEWEDCQLRSDSSRTWEYYRIIVKQGNNNGVRVRSTSGKHQPQRASKERA